MPVVTLISAVAPAPPAHILPVSCFATYCSFEESFFAIGAPQLILFAGALIVNRWRDVVLVGVAATLAVIVGTLAVAGWDDLGRDREEIACNVAFLIALMTAIAAAVQTAKRLIAWIVRQIIRDPTDFFSSMVK